jgi:hypothetical protein
MKTLAQKRRWVNNRPFTLLEDVTFDHEKQIEVTHFYARVALGLAWSSDKAGAIVAVAEELVNAPGKPGLYVLDIFESTDDHELLVKALEMRASLKWEDCFANKHNTPLMSFTQQFNRARHERKDPEIHLRQAPFLEPDGLIVHHLQMVKLLLEVGDKRLYLGEHQRIASAMANISTSEMHTRHDYDEPLLAALGFAASYLQAFPFHIEPSEKDRKKGGMWGPLEDGYDPLGEKDPIMAWDPFSATDKVFNYNPK